MHGTGERAGEEREREGGKEGGKVGGRKGEVEKGRKKMRVISPCANSCKILIGIMFSCKIW